jgi:hypothetical protein
MNNIEDLIDQLILILEPLEPQSRKEVVAKLYRRYQPDFYHIGGVNIIIGGNGNNLVSSDGIGFQNTSDELNKILANLPKESLEEVLKTIIAALQKLYTQINDKS